MEGFQTRHIVRCRETSSCGEKEPADCVVKAKELRRPWEKRIEF
jgi:hypothetical protein